MRHGFRYLDRGLVSGLFRGLCFLKKDRGGTGSKVTTASRPSALPRDRSTLPPNSVLHPLKKACAAEGAVELVKFIPERRLAPRLERQGFASSNI